MNDEIIMLKIEIEELKRKLVHFEYLESEQKRDHIYKQLMNRVKERDAQIAKLLLEIDSLNQSLALRDLPKGAL